NTPSDLWVEMGWRLLQALLIILGAPLLIIGLVGSHQIQQRFPDRQRLAWSILVVLALIGGYLGYHFFWPLDQPGSAFVILLKDVGRGLHSGGRWDDWRLLHELLSVWGIELLLAPTAIIVFGALDWARPKSPARIAYEREQQRSASRRRACKVAERALV